MNKIKIINELEKRIEKANEACSIWENSTDGSMGACLHAHKYHKMQRIVKGLKKSKLEKVLDNEIK